MLLTSWLKSTIFVIMKRYLIFWMLWFPMVTGISQVVYENRSNQGIYEFLDEMATSGFITLHSAVKPYSRVYIAQKLTELSNLNPEKDGKPGLNKRQQQELRFYLEDYQAEIRVSGANYRYGIPLVAGSDSRLDFAFLPAGLHYRDSLFILSVRPVLGMEFSTNHRGNMYQRWWGGEMYGYIGRHFGFYAELRDNNASEAPVRPGYLTLKPGAVYKERENGTVDFSEMRGGLSASVRWGSLAILLDRPEWGDHYHGAGILSGHAPAFPHIDLHLHPVRWFEFHYIHAWLNSNIIDSSRSYWANGDYRTIYRNKFLAANLFTFTPWRGLDISIGNSVIYSDQDVNLLYLVPFLFYNAADAIKNNYSNEAGSNSQMFFNISSRQIRHLHLYASLFVDEWKTSRLFDSELHNFTSLKGGFRLTGLPLGNVAVGAEYTRTMPMTYKHFIPSSSFMSNDFYLGHYLADNAEEISIMASWRPLRGLMLSGVWTAAVRGEDLPYSYHSGYQVDKIPYLQNKTWQNHSLELSARYEFSADGYGFLSYLYSDRTGNTGLQPVMFQGVNSTFSAGICLGW